MYGHQLLILRFNSLMVRLKEPIQILALIPKVGFNSLMVRLKDKPLRPVNGHGREFQFLDGSIKSVAQTH